MSVAYLVSNNGKLTREGDIFKYFDYLGNVTKLIPERTDELIVIGTLDITGPALYLLMKHKIKVYFFYKNGKNNGQFVFEDPKNVLLRHKQHLLIEDRKFVTTTARDIVRGKIHNQYLFLQRIGRKTENISISRALVEFDKLKKSLDCVDTVDKVRGIEGASANIYFSLFGYNILADWICFNGRNKNPPLDEVNAVLSFLYTVLASKVSSALVKTGLDLAVGTLHALTYGRNSLVFDLLEEFRTPLVDTVTCALFNQGVLKKGDFYLCRDFKEEDEEGIKLLQVEDSDLQEGVFLTRDGIKKVLFAFEKKLDQEHFYPMKEKSLSYRKIIEEQAYLYRQLIGGFIDHYQPMVIR